MQPVLTWDTYWLWSTHGLSQYCGKNNIAYSKSSEHPESIEINLYAEDTEHVRRKVCATITNRCLTIYGWDAGAEVATHYNGRCNVFEFWYELNVENTKRLLTLLPGEDRNSTKLLYGHFNGLDGCQKLEAFCKENEIEYRYNCESSHE